MKLNFWVYYHSDVALELIYSIPILTTTLIFTTDHKVKKL